MICCDAPADATTTEVRVPINLGTVKELVATDVRGLLFPTVYKYTEEVRTRWWWRTRVEHVWGRGGQHRIIDMPEATILRGDDVPSPIATEWAPREERALWHWKDEDAPKGL